MAHTVSTGVTIPFSDGTGSAADLWLTDPESSGPTILIRTPYGRRTLFHQSPIDALGAIERGYHFVIQDVRGRGASGGDFAPFAQERADGFDTIEWIADQAWSDGRVVMTGPSYVGAAQWLAASSGPLALKAIAPLNSSAHFGEGWTFTNGVRERGFLTSWISSALASESAGLGDRIDEIDADPSAALAAFPPARPWFELEAYDEYWAEIDAWPTSASALSVAVLTVTGWYDIFMRGALASWTERSMSADRLIIGPWGHDNYFSHLNGDANLGRAGAGEAAGLGALILDFFDDVLAGREARQPRVQVYEIGSKRWVMHDSWPPSGSSDVHLPLAEAAFVVDLDDLPVLVGGRGLRVGTVDSGWGPVDATALAHRADIAYCEIPALDKDLLVSGAVSIQIDSIAPVDSDAQWVGLLCTREANGALTMIADGVAVQPLHTSLVEVQLGHLGAHLPAGTDLVVLICGGLQPRWQRPRAGGGARRIGPQSHLTVRTTPLGCEPQ